MKKLKENIPNSITCGNLLCGCIAIIKVFEGNLILAAYLVGLAAVLDFFDGFVARLLKVSSKIGKDLDSLADAVTFGVVPGMMMFSLLKLSISHSMLSFLPTMGVIEESIIPYIAMLIPIFSVVRLAKFNNDTRQTGSFIGVPTPANAILIASLVLIVFDRVIHSESFTQASSFSGMGEVLTGMFEQVKNPWHNDGISNLIMNQYFLISLTVVMSFLLVAEIPLFALKFKNFTWRNNQIRYIFLIISLVLLVCFQYLAIPIIIFLYILFSVINNLFLKKTNK